MSCINHSLCHISSPTINYHIFSLWLFFLKITFTSIVKEPIWSHHFEQQLGGKSNFLFAHCWRAVNVNQRPVPSREEFCWLRRWGTIWSVPPLWPYPWSPNFWKSARLSESFLFWDWSSLIGAGLRRPVSHQCRRVRISSFSALQLRRCDLRPKLVQKPSPLAGTLTLAAPGWGKRQCGLKVISYFIIFQFFVEGFEMCRNILLILHSHCCVLQWDLGFQIALCQLGLSDSSQWMLASISPVTSWVNVNPIMILLSSNVQAPHRTKFHCAKLRGRRTPSPSSIQLCDWHCSAPWWQEADCLLFSSLAHGKNQAILSAHSLFTSQSRLYAASTT